MRVGVVMVIPFRSLLVPVVILCALPLAVFAAGMWIAYSVGDGPYGVAPAAAAMLSMASVEARRVGRGRLGHGSARGSRRSLRRARGQYESAPGPPP
jgi:hypothetical protein